jgi:integrase/recombinase XerD
MSDQSFSHEMWLSTLRDHLQKERYSPRTAERCLVVARQFMTSIQKQNIDVSNVRQADVERYLQQERRKYSHRHGHPPDYKGWWGVYTSSIHMLLRLAQGQWPPVWVSNPTGLLQQELCEPYVQWMRGVRGLSPITVSNRCAEAHRLLSWLGKRDIGKAFGALTLGVVEDYLKDRTSCLRRRSLSGVATNVRSFLRWLHWTGQTSCDLSPIMIAPSLHAFESIPSALRAEHVKKVLEVTRKDCTPKGIRDYAILQLLSTYGVRAGEITTLRLDDIDWRREIIRIRHSKTAKTSYIPLLPEPGEALLKYLQKSRPVTSLREVFLRCHAPYRPFKEGSSLYGMVRYRLETAGVITSGKRGPHAFRHARAVSMLRATVPVKQIGDLLGHSAADSTLVYLKLATEDLRTVALEIPAGVSA